MTLTKTETGRRAVMASERRLQDATDKAYRSIVDLWLTAESHAHLCQSLGDGPGEIQTTNSLMRVLHLKGQQHPFWPGHARVENVLHWALEAHRVVGRDAWSRVELPVQDGRVPPPNGT